MRAQQLRAIKHPESDKYSHLTNGIVSGLTAYGRIAGRYGMDLRDPWADRRLLEFFQRLPMEYKIKDGWTKYIVRVAFASDLDKKVVWRRGKEHLGWTFVRSVMDHTHESICSQLEGDLGMLGAYVDENILVSRLNRYKVERSDEDAMFFYDILTLKLWLERNY